MIVIAKDGTGNFSTVQEGIDAAAVSGQPETLLIRKGIYHERLAVYPDGLRLIGEDPENTVITGFGCAHDKDSEGNDKGTFLSATVVVTGKGVTFENLTIRNDAGDGRDVGQAVAVYAAGDRGIWRNCRLIAHQDTLFCGPVMPKVLREIHPYTGNAECVPSAGDCPLTHSRQYFEHCYIQGDIDFIFGPYTCWFEQCTLWMNRRGGYYTAANTPEGQPYGLVFNRCRLTGDCEEGAAFLGRPWRKFAQTVFLFCDMDEHVAPGGFADWDTERIVTERYGEYGTAGIRKGQETRHPGQKRMTEEEAARYSIPAVLGGADCWRPDLPPEKNGENADGSAEG